MEMRLVACVTRGPSQEPYQTISTVYFKIGILRMDLWSQGRVMVALGRIRNTQEARLFKHHSYLANSPKASVVVYGSFIRRQSIPTTK